MDWADVINAVADELGAYRLHAGGDPSRSPSLLGALTSSAPPGLRRRLARDQAATGAVTGDIEPLIYQNELPVRLLSNRLVGIAARAVASAASEDEPFGRDPRITAIVAISALSTLRLDRDIDSASVMRTRPGGWESGDIRWTMALDSLAERTAQLAGLLRLAAGDRRQTWRQVGLEDRILAEAVAAAVVGGAASGSGVPVREWTFPFHLFCNMGVSAAKLSLTTIENWLRTEFLPGPLAPERTASLAVLLADEASALEHGCGCKTDSGEGKDEDEIAYVRRGSCRQADHDLRAWLPGQHKPGSRTGARYASTLWGWQRRWLGGSSAGSAASEESLQRLRLRTNDVASSVLARRWLGADRGFGGPAMLYDRILPEFCLACGRKVELSARTGAAGHTIIDRVRCCEQQELVYRSEYIKRGSKVVLRPKLGIIVTWPSQDAGSAGYGSTAPLGPLWVCNRCGRYTLCDRHCPSDECRADGRCVLGPVHHGWVLLPLSDAWENLKKTGVPAADETAGTSHDGALSPAELRYLADICGKLPSGRNYRINTPADVWALASSWSTAETAEFTALGKRHGLELLLRCKEIAQEITRAQADGDKSGHGALNNRTATARNDKGTAAGSERVDRDD